MLKDILLCAAGLTAIFIVPTIIVGLMWRRAVRRGTSTHEAWFRIADDLNLTYKPKHNILGTPVAGMLYGNYMGRGLILESIRDASLPIPFITPGDERWFFRIGVGLKPHRDLKLSFSEKGLIKHLDPFKRGAVISTGDQVFDGMFTVCSDSEDAARRVFASAFLRKKLVQGPAPPFEIHPDHLQSEIQAEDYGLEYWKSTIEVLFDIAEAIESI